MKTVGLDIGDAWTGSAISDPLGIIARPYRTVATSELNDFLKAVFDEEDIATIIIGYPKTMKGTESEQTKKIVNEYQRLTELFPDKEWLLWDERLSSKRAESLKKPKTKDDKLVSHSVAAAFILESYLTFKNIKK